MICEISRVYAPKRSSTEQKRSFANTLSDNHHNFINNGDISNEY